MKKSSLIVFGVFALFAYTAFSVSHWRVPSKPGKIAQCKNPALFLPGLNSTFPKAPAKEFFLKVGPRFHATITKESLEKVLSLQDILPKGEPGAQDTFQETQISLLHPDRPVTKKGFGDQLTEGQLQLFKSITYSNHFSLRANYQKRNPVSGALENDYRIYSFTVIPEKEATLDIGLDSLVDYLRNSIEDETSHLLQNHLKPGRIHFTIKKTGEVGNLLLESDCGYPTVGNKLIQLLRDMPGVWQPASNSSGEKIDQEMVLFFGLMDC